MPRRLRAAAHDRQRRLHRLLHDFAQLAGGRHLALAGHDRRLDRQQLAADLGPREARRPARPGSSSPPCRRCSGARPGTCRGCARTPRSCAPRLSLTSVFTTLRQILDSSRSSAAHAGFARVVADDVAHRALRDRQLLGLQAVVLHQLGQQVLQRDVHLLVLGVAREADRLHPVEQRRRDVERVGGAHEHHVGEVVLDFDVVVDEGVVLLGIEHFEQRARRIAAEIHAHLVDFVEQEQRIAHADLGHVLQDLARHRADVGAAVAADLGLVAHAAQRHAHELAVGRARDRLAERGLAHAGRADQAQDRRLQLVHALLHREVLDDALLDLLQPVVVLVEDLLGGAEIGADLALLLPRQRDDRVDVVAHDGRLGRHRRHQLQLLQLRLRPSCARPWACARS